MKTIFLTVLVGFVATCPLFADPISLHFRNSAGIQYGEGKEYVFENGAKLSELTYQLHPLWFDMLSASFSWDGVVNIDAGLKLGLPSKSGKIFDYDYLNLDGQITNYSENDGNLSQFVGSTLRVDHSIVNVIPGLVMKPFLAGSYLNYRWIGTDGFYQYPPETSAPYSIWNSSETKVPLYGSSVIYDQKYEYVSGGLEVTCEPLSKLEITLQVDGSPFVWVQDQDQHLLRSVVFSEKLDHGTQLGAGVGISYVFNQVGRIGLNLSYLNIGNFDHGPTTSEDLNDGTSSQLDASYTASAGLYVFDFSLTWTSE